MLLNFSTSEVKGLFWLRLAYFSFLLVLFFLCRRLRLERILAPVVGGIALILFVYGVFQKFLIFPRILEQAASGHSFYAQALRIRIASGRIFAIFALPTLYAMICGLLLIFIVHYFYHSRGWARTFWALLFLLGGFNLVLTQSFGGILFFAAGSLFYLFSSRIFKVKFLAPLLMVLALVLFLVTALRFSEARELAPARLRLANWAQAGRLIEQAPLLGVGLGNYETAVPPHVRRSEPASIYAHNFFLQLAAETGVPLFLLLAVVFLAWLKRNMSGFLKAENAVFAGACILILFFNMFDVGSFFLAAGVSLAVALSQVARMERPARLHNFVAAALLAAVLLVQAYAADRQKSGDLWLSQGDPARAEALYKDSLRFNPHSYRAWLGLAHIARQRGDRMAADRALRKVLEIHPGQPYANYLLSVSSWQRGAYLTALFHARCAARANRRNKEYQRWHEVVQGNFSLQPPRPGN